jgi:hypothetical protein
MEYESDRMGSSPADSRFINEQPLQRMMMTMMMVVVGEYQRPSDFFLSHTFLFLLHFFCSFPRRPLSPSILFPYGGHTSPRRETIMLMSTTGGKERE